MKVIRKTGTGVRLERIKPGTRFKGIVAGRFKKQEREREVSKNVFMLR